MIKISLAGCLFFLCILACKKETVSPVTPQQATTYIGSLYWQESSGGVIKADSAFWKYTNGYTSIYAYKGGTNNMLFINFTGNLNYVDAFSNSLLLYNSATYTLVSNSNVGLRYIKSPITYSSNGSSTLYISNSQTVATNANNIITGYIKNVPLTGGSVSAISATFFTLPNKN